MKRPGKYVQSLDERFGLSQRSHLGLTDELLQTCNLSPDLVLFADKVMDTLGQLLLVRKKDQQHMKRAELMATGPSLTEH